MEDLTTIQIFIAVGVLGLFVALLGTKLGWIFRYADDVAPSAKKVFDTIDAVVPDNLKRYPVYALCGRAISLMSTLAPFIAEAERLADSGVLSKEDREIHVIAAFEKATKNTLSEDDKQSIRSAIKAAVIVYGFSHKISGKS